MSTNTLARPSLFAVGNGFGFKPVMFRKDSGALRMEKVAVFRSGSFRDSWGEMTTWEDMHIKQMVENFEHLRSNSLFDDVPVRDGHPNLLLNGLPGNGKVVGWHTSLRSEKTKAPHDEEEYNYVFADFEITDPRAVEMVESGTWRNRSAEIITYRTNNEAEYWPVYGGFAYVDIPAVEGLKFSASTGAPAPRIYVMFDKEKPVGDNPTGAAPAQQPANSGTGALPFSAQPAAPHVFAVNGRQVTDYAAVQTHINVLEKFRADTQEKNRRDFVTGLASANRIAASQIDKLSEFAVNLAPEQFDAWKATFEDAPVVPALGQSVDGVSNHSNSAQTGTDAKAAQFAVWRETVRQHKLAGATLAQIKETPSYKALVAAGESVDL